jgi:glutamine amidotransferase
MTAIIDFDAGNVRSVLNAMKSLGEEAVLTSDPEEILGADHVIIPGEGAFGMAMEKIRQRRLEEVILEVAASGTPFLGICIGQQLLFDASEESPGVKGLGILHGTCRKIKEGEGRKIPEIGWNDLSYPNPGRLFRGIPEHSFVYFVHSYYACPDDLSIVTAANEYGGTLTASVEKDNVFACQFHPEKSAEVGRKILSNFLEVSKC